MDQQHAAEVIPSSHLSWRYCIEKKCRIQLTDSYIRSRLEALANPHDEHTRHYRKLYGEQQLTQVRGWFEQALRELSKQS